MNPLRRRVLQACALLAIAPRVGADGSLDAVSGQEATQVLRETLERGARAAIARLGKENGYFGDPKVKIGLPRNFTKAERILRGLGQGRKVDDLVLAMNRAAESAVPRARELVVDAVRRMAVNDARSILASGDNAATDYFRKSSETQLAEGLLPLVRSVSRESGLARAYTALANKLMSLASIESELATVENYVNKKALNGIYIRIAEEEHALRTLPPSSAAICSAGSTDC